MDECVEANELPDDQLLGLISQRFIYEYFVLVLIKVFNQKLRTDSEKGKLTPSLTPKSVHVLKTNE